ncbi:hypothetical protein LINPERPRIM_LOCUS38831 [Linum perenne]
MTECSTASSLLQLP